MPSSSPPELGPERLRVAVVGAGNIGAGAALMFARAGYRVGMYNRGPSGRDRALEWMRLALGVLVENGFETAAGAEEALSRLSPTSDLEEAAAGAGYVLEAVAEDLEIKKEVFRRLDAVCPPPAILATDTSGLSITKIASATRRPERVVGVHHFTPPHLVPGVELVAGAETSPETVDRTEALLRRLGKRPVRVPDVPGFIANRLSCALRREAWAIVEEGLASPEDVDELWTATVGPIYAAIGPLHVCDASGLDVLLAVHEHVEPVLWPPSEPSAMVRQMRDRGDLGLKSGKGFYDWPPEQAAEFIRRRDALLLAMLGPPSPRR